MTSPPNNLFFTVDMASLPNWLSVDATSGTTGTGGTVGTVLNFSSTNVADTMSPGTNTAYVNLKVSGYKDKTVAIVLTVKNPIPVLSVQEGTVRNLTWLIGQPLPAPFVTAISSDSAIPFTLTAGGNVAQPVNNQGVALTSGTQIPVTFTPLAFAQAQPGSMITGTLTLNWTSGVTAKQTMVSFNIAVQSAGATATLSSIAPTNLPTAAAGQTFTVTLYGSGFNPSADTTQKTTVGIVSSGTLIQDANISSNVVNSSTIVLTIVVPSSVDANLDFTKTNNPVVLGVCNPSGGACTQPTGGTQTLKIGAGPTIQSVTSASSFSTVAIVAPYDMISIFGSNFCSSNGTGCNANTILYGVPDPTTLTLATWLSPDAGQRPLTVTFQTPAVVGPPASAAVTFATAPLLFATNNQINLLVPWKDLPVDGTAIEMVVNFGTLHSDPWPLIVAKTHPGIFTIDSNSNGAILNAAGGLVGPGNEAGMRAVSTDSDTVEIYVTGLGVMDSDALIGDSGPACVSTASYKSYASIPSVDGAVIQNSLLNFHYPPCFKTPNTAVKVSIGGVDSLVTYAGWVADSIAGLYQINVQLPSKDDVTLTDAANVTAALTVNTASSMPVVVKMALDGNKLSQQAYISVKPKLTLSLSSTGWSATAPNYTAAPTTATIGTVTGSGGLGTPTYVSLLPRRSPDYRLTRQAE